MKYEDLSEESKKFVDEMAARHGKTREEVIKQASAVLGRGFKKAGILS